MTEQQVIRWMQQKVQRDGFMDAANLAKEFLTQHNITSSIDPCFQVALHAGFQVAMEQA
jgi:hypothetical protein